MMGFEETIEEIKKYTPKGEMKWNKYFGLEKIKYLMELVDNPQDKLKYVHITGTSGKGSTAYMVASILKESGYKTGLHVSPHIYTPQERAQVNGKLISKEDFCRIYAQLVEPIRLTEEKFEVPPSYYEILLAIAWMYFAEQKCEIVVIEVGLGGRLDSTNIIKSDYQIITNIGLDHMSILGNTKEEILRDKQEINKNKSIIVSGIKEEGLKKVLKSKAKTTKSEVYFLNEDFEVKNRARTSFDLELEKEKIDRLEIKTWGIFQTENAAVAAMTGWKMRKDCSKITRESIKNGLEKIIIPGRWEILGKEPMVVVDGAHNPDKTRALVESTISYFPGQKWIVLFRYKRRKDVGKSLALLSRIAEKIIITGSKSWGDMGWDETYTEEDKNTLENIKVEVELDLNKAVELARKYSQNKIPVLATGSMFMIKEFSDCWQKKC